MKLLVCGGRDYNDREYLERKLDEISRLFGPIHLVIDGAARGADTLAHNWAMARGIPAERFPADWNRYGKRAGSIRNREMAGRLSSNDLVVAFPGGRGTADMIKVARAIPEVNVIEVGR